MVQRVQIDTFPNGYTYRIFSDNQAIMIGQTKRMSVRFSSEAMRGTKSIVRNKARKFYGEICCAQDGWPGFGG